MPSMPSMHLMEALAQTERDLSAAQILVRNLSDQRLQLRKDLNSTAPISLLPWDLKHNIFLAVSGGDGGRGDNGGRGRGRGETYRMPVLSLAAVCAEWRQISLDIPQLWGKIYLPFHHKKMESGVIWLDHAKLSVVKEWLIRGKQAPLSITVFLRKESAQEESVREELPPGELPQALFLELLNEYSGRWRHIALHNALPENFKLRMFDLPGNLPLLHASNIYSVDEYDPHDDDTDEPLCETPYFRDAPSLRIAEIGTFSLEEIILPWHQLEILHAEGQPISVYHALSSSHNLLKCSLYIQSRHNEFIPQTITLPKLQTLALTGGGCGLVKYLHVPALKDYRHSLYNGNACYDFDALSGLIKRSSCHLNVLHVNANMMDGGFLRCVQLLSSLVELELYSFNGSIDDAFGALQLPDSFINSLNPDTDKHTLLPKLEIFNYSGLTDFHFMTLLAMLCRRGRRGSSAVSQITELSIHSKNAIPGFNDAAMKELGSLRDEGIKIEIKAGWIKEDHRFLTGFSVG